MAGTGAGGTILERAVSARGVRRRDAARSAVQGTRYAVLAAVLLGAVLLLAAPALAGRWNEIDGTAKADHISGTEASDRIFGLEGNDHLRGGAGDDRLVGGPGDDVLDGGLGQDAFICGGGEDVVVVDSSPRFVERIGHGCETVIFDV